jgi:CheY-like chemotaxis protein
VFFRDHFALQALEIDLTLRGDMPFREALRLIVGERTPDGKLALDASGKPVSPGYFPEFSFTRDDLLFELLEKSRDPEDLKMAKGFILQFQENVLQEEVRKHVFAENKIREAIQQSSNSDKKEFALWIMGLRKTKPFMIKEVEFLYGIDLSYLRDVFNTKAVPHFPQVGTSLKRDLIDGLFGGPDGLLKDPGHFRSFLNRVFDKNVPWGTKNRGKLRKIFMTVFKHIPDEKKLEILSALSAKIRAGEKTDPAELTRVFFESFGLLGIKAGQIISHSDMTIEASLRDALKSLSSSADPQGKKNVLQFMELIFGDQFDAHFQGVLRRLGSASIKVVYEMLTAEGEHVVLKLKRPQIDKVIDEELKVFDDILQDLRRQGLKIPEGLGKQIGRYVREEVDFAVERSNRDRFDRMLKSRGRDLVLTQGPQRRKVELTTPKGRPELDALIPESLRNVAIFEEMVTGGIDLNNTERLGAELGLTPGEIEGLKKMVFDDLLDQMFIDGFFHADPHGGNILVRKKGDTGDLEIVFIDLGSTGSNDLEVRAADLARLPAADLSAVTVNGKPFFVRLPEGGEETASLNLSITAEDFEREPESPIKNTLEAMWKESRASWETRRRQLAEWLMYMGLNKGKAPPIPEDKFLEATFFKKIPYLLEAEGVDEFTIAKSIFAKLGLTFPPDDDRAKQIMAVRLASRGDWARIEAGDFSPTLRERAESKAMDALARLRGRSEMRGESVPTSLEKVAASTEAVRRFYGYVKEKAFVPPASLHLGMRQHTLRDDGRTFELIEGGHGHPGISEAMVRLSERVFSDPGDWMIYFEGGEDLRQGFDHAMKTAQYAEQKTMAKILLECEKHYGEKLPVINTLPTGREPEVLEGIQGQVHLSREEVLTAQFYELFGVLLIEGMRQRATVRQAVETFLKNTRTDHEDPLRLLVDHARKIAGSETEYEAMAGRMTQVMQAGIMVRNAIAREKMATELAKYPGRKNVLAYVGTYHAGVFGLPEKEVKDRSPDIVKFVVSNLQAGGYLRAGEQPGFRAEARRAAESKVRLPQRRAEMRGEAGQGKPVRLSLRDMSSDILDLISELKAEVTTAVRAGFLTKVAKVYPDSSDGRRKILYPGSGGDALTFFLATDATDGYFVTLEKASGSQLKNALKELEYSRGHFQYLSQRRRKGVQTFASSQWLQQFPNILMLIVPELFALGVRDMDIRDHGGGKIELRFDWRHPNDPAPKPRTLTLLSSTNLKRQNTYMDTLPPDLDGVFSKAIGGAGAIGDAKNSFSPDFEGAIAKKLSPDAVIVTDHPANWVVRLGNDVNLFNPKGFGKKGKSAPQNLNFGHHRIAFLKRQTALPMSDDEKLDLLFDDLEFKTTPWFHPGFGEFFLEQLRKNPEVLMSLKSRLQGLVNRMGSNVGKNREVIDALVKYSALIGRVGPRFKRKEAQAVLVMLNSLSDRVANHRVYPGDLIVLKMYLLVAQAKIVQDVLKNNKKRDSLMKEARNLTELDILAEPWAAQKLLKDLTSFYGVGRSEIRREAERAERLSGTRPEADASGTSKHIGTGRSDMRDQERAEIRRETERAERLSGTRDQERAEIRRGEEPVASGTESERRGPKKKTIYEYLGVKPWRKAVWSQLAPFPYFSNTQGLRGQALLDTLKAFVDFTRQKERYHLVAIAAWIFLWGFVFYGLPPFLGVQPMPWFVKIAMGIHGVFMVLVDVYPVFLQRHNRLKAERIIRKLIQRGEDKPADPARIRKAVDTALKNDTTYRRNLDYEKYGDRPLATGYQAYRIVSADERGPGESPEDFLKRQFDRLVMGGRLVITATNNEELENFRHLLFELAGATGADLESFRIADDPKRLEAVRGEAYFMILEKKSPFWFSQDGVLEPESPVSKMGLKEAPQKLSESMPSVADMEPIETFLRERLTPDAQPLLDRFMDRVWFSISHSRIPANEQGFWFKRFFENILPWDGEELEKYLREVNLFFDETISLFGDDKQTALQLPRVLRLLEWFLAFVTRFSIYRSEGSSVSDATRLIRQLRSLWARIAFFAGEADRIRTLRETLPVLVNLVMQMRSEPNRGASLADDNNWFGLQSLLMAPEITFGGISYKKTHVYPPHYDSDHAFAEGKNPIFQMELVNPQDGKRIYVLAKRIGRATGYDEIYQASAKKLGLSSYEVETYREPHGMPMILIEYVPADLIAATVEKQDQGVVHLKGAPTEFNTSGIKNFLTGAEADVVRRLRELGGHLALEDLLGARDSTMKHFLFSKEEPRRIVKIDTEYLLDFEGAWKRNIPGPLQPESDVISFLRAIGEGPNGKVWLQAVEDGFNEIKTKAQANADALEEIILSRNGRVTPADLAPMRERLTRTFQQLRQSYTAPTTRAEMRGDLPGAALELADALNEYSKGVRDVSPYLPLHDLLGNESGEHLHGLLGGLLADIPNLSDPDQPDELAKDVYQSVKELNRALKTSTNVMIVFFKAESGAAVMEKKLPETAHFVVVDRREIERHIRELGMNSQGRAERILVAEDDEKLMKTYQSWADFIKTTELGEFDVVENGKKGLEKLRESEKLQKRTDLILSDVDMPEMDGIGMVESYRRESKGPAVPVVWVTGRGRNELGEAKDWVRTSYVGKPSFWHKTLLDEHFALLTGILMALDEREGGLGQQRESRSELRASEALAETRLAKTKGEIFRSFDAGNRVVIQVREDIFEPSAPVGLVMGTHSVNIFDPLVVDESGQYKLVAHMALMGFQKNGEDGSYDIDAEHLRAYVRNNGYLERGIYALMTAEENGHRLIGRLGGHGSPSTRTIDAERLYFRLKKDTDPRLRQLAEKDPSVAKRIGFYQGSLAVKPGIKFDIRRIYEGPGARRIDVHVTDLSEVKPSEPLAAVAREEIALKSARLVEIVATLRDLLGRIPGKQIKLSEEAGQEKLDRLFSEWDEINAQLDRLEGRIVEPSDSLKEFTKNYFLSGQADKPRSEMRSDEDEAFVEQMITQAVGYQLLGEPFTQQFQRHKEQTIGLISSLAGQVPSDVKSCVLAVRTLVENAFSLWAQSRGFEPIMRDGQAGNIHPQEFINKAITFPVFFNSDGKVTDLIQWVRDHYSHLDQYGVQVDILLQSANAVKADMSFYDDLRSKKEEWGKIEDVLNTCADHGISIPVLVIRRQGQGQKRVPMILTYGKNDYWGIYQATASPAGTREDRILIQSLAGRLEEQVRNKETFPNMVATLIHEIDHAIFEFIHSAGNRKLFDELFEVVQLHEKLETVRVNAVATEAVTLQKQMDDLKAKEEELRKTISMNQTFDRTGFVIVKEGLAMHSEGQFLEDQLNGLAERFAQTKGLEKTQVASAFQLLTAYDRALTHMLPGMILYAVGNVLIELFIRNGTPAEDFYLSNILESKIVKNRMLLLLFLKLLLQGQKPLAERISPDIAEAFTPEYIRSRIEERVGPQFNDLLMGREYQEMFDQIDELVAGMDRGRLLDLSGDAEADSLDVPEEALRNRVRKAMRDYAVDLKLRDMWKLILPAAAPVLQPQGASAETGALGRPEMRGENAEALVRGVVDALDPDPASRTVFNEAEVGQLSELLKLDFETVVRKIIELAEQRIGARKAQLGEGEKAAPSSAQSAVEQSQALLEWWKKRVESRKPLRGQVSLAVRLGNATAHDSFLKQLLKVLGEQERKATLFSDKASSKYVAKAIGAQGLRSWVSSIPLQAKDMTAGISELHRQDQPDVPIGLLEGTDSAQKMSDTFVGVALDEGEAPLDPDAVFHNELLFAIILGELMPDIISTEAYQEEVRAKVGRLLPPEKEKPEKIREIKAETLKAALLKLLEQIGYTSEIFSSQSAQFLTLNGAQIARMITEIRARAEIRKAA